MELKYFAPLVLRLGVGLTFLLLGIDQLLHPQNWYGYLAPWAQTLLGQTPEKFFFTNAIFDISIGSLLIFGVFTRWVALIAALHLIGVLANIGYSEIAIRDIGIMMAALALAIHGKTPYGVDSILDCYILRKKITKP